MTATAVDVKTSAEHEADEVVRVLQSRDLTRKPSIRVDPFMIAQELGIAAFSAGLSEDIFAMIIKKPGEDPQVYVQERDSYQQQRLACAITLGRYVYRLNHGDYNDWEYIERGNPLTRRTSDEEQEFATIFGVSMLLPRETLQELCGEFSLSVLAERFYVTPETLYYRLNMLGLSPKQLARLY